MLEDLSAAIFGGAQNAYAPLGTRDKLPEISQYVYEHRRLPGVLIFLEEDGLLDVVDGCHRLLLYVTMKSSPLPQDLLNHDCDAWIGSPTGGEL
jgi:hypothetical protein